jgi:hypothetical protein
MNYGERQTLPRTVRREKVMIAEVEQRTGTQKVGFRDYFTTVRHVFVREEQGLRAGGFGILITSQIVDELVYNERHNEVLFVKCLS